MQVVICILYAWMLLHLHTQQPTSLVIIFQFGNCEPLSVNIHSIIEFIFTTSICPAHTYLWAASLNLSSLYLEVNMSIYNEAKRRRISRIKKDYDHVPKAEQIVKLLCGEENFRTKPDLLSDGNIMHCPCPREDHLNCTTKWRSKSGYSNALSKLKTCFGGKYIVMDAYWVAYFAKQRDGG